MKKSAMQKDWYSYVIPDVLVQYDISQLENYLGARLVKSK